MTRTLNPAAFRRRRQAVVAGACAMLLAAGCGPTAEEPPGSGEARGGKDAHPLPAGMEVEPGEPAERFTLTAQDGEPFDSASLAGKVWVGSIFFANCPGPCFRENQAIRDLLAEFEDDDVVAVSITCDPENDTPAVLEHYAARFEADPRRWIFLTGEMPEIKRIANDILFLPAEVGVHAERGVVFDRQGRLRGSFHLLDPDRIRRMKAMIRDLLDEPAADADDPAGSEEA